MTQPRAEFELRPVPGRGRDGSAVPPRHTGRLLVTTRVDVRKSGEPTTPSLRHAADALSSSLGVSVVHSSDHRGDPEGLREAVGAVGERTAVMFDRLGIVVVVAQEDWQRRLSVDVTAAESPVTRFERERYVWATTDYLQGYRDGVTGLTDALRQGGTLPAAPTVGVERFSDDARFTWGLRAVGADATEDLGEGARVAVLDTGADDAHPDVAASITAARSFVSNPDAGDVNGHGTHCAGTIAGRRDPDDVPRFGVAPGAELFVAKVLDDAGQGTDTTILAGIEWALENGCHVVSMSLGGPVPPDVPHSATFEAVARTALDRGTIIVAAAGNDSDRPGTVAPISHPANCPSIVAVAALDQSLRPAPFSNGGGGGVDHIDIAAPGVDVLSSVPGGAHGLSSGTSMATPHVAGVAAVLHGREGVTGGALIARLLLDATGVEAASVDVGTGLARVDAVT